MPFVIPPSLCLTSVKLGRPDLQMALQASLVATKETSKIEKDKDSVSGVSKVKLERSQLRGTCQGIHGTLWWTVPALGQVKKSPPK